MKLLIFISVFIPLYILYLITMPPTVFWQDSGIFLAGLRVFGILFPPGFPLYMILGEIWLKLLSILSPISYLLSLNFAQQVHAFSGLWGAGASAVIGLSVYQLLIPEPNTIYPRKSYRFEIIISIISGLTAGLSYSLWAQSTNAEVYSLTGFFASLLFFLVIKITQAYPQNPFDKGSFLTWRKNYQKYLLLLAFVWGLSFGVHLLTITFIIPLLWLSFALRFFPLIRVRTSENQTYKPLLSLKAWLLITLVFLLCALVPYLYLPLRSTPDNQLLWSQIESPQAFVEHITGKVYMGSEKAIKAADLEKLKSYPILFFREFFLVGIFLGIIGFLSLVRRKTKPARTFASFGAIFALTLYLLISFYERGTEYNYWLIPFYLFWSILIGVGLAQVAGKIKIFALRILVVLLLFLGILVPPFWVNWPILNRANYVLAEEFGKNLIGKLPQKAIFFTLGDQESSISLYLNLVLGYRQDLAVIADSDILFDWKRELLSRRRLDLIFPPVTDQDPFNTFIEANLDKGVFVITKNYLPLSDEFKLVPAGTIWQIKRINDPGEINLRFWNYVFSDPNRYLRPERPELARKNNPERAPYFDEVRVFELQAKKNLGDWCYEAWQAKKKIPVLTREGKHEIWQGDKLAECALQAYEAMFKIDPKFENKEIESRISKLTISN